MDGRVFLSGEYEGTSISRDGGWSSGALRVDVTSLCAVKVWPGNNDVGFYRGPDEGLRAHRPAPGRALDQVLIRSLRDRIKEESVEIAATAARSTSCFDVVEDCSAFGDIGIRASGDARTIQGFDGGDAGVDVNLGRAAEIAATIANAEGADVRIGKSGHAAAGENAIGSVNELLASSRPVEFVVVTATPSYDDCGKKTQ